MKKRSIKLTKFEFEIMNYLWSNGPSPIRDVQESYPEKTRPAYTTVQTIVYRLENKQFAHRTRKIGNAHIFAASITRAEGVDLKMRELLDQMGGMKNLLQALLETKKISKFDLEVAVKEAVSANGKAIEKKTAAKRAVERG